MIDKKQYLQHGLDIISCAYETNYFADGHRGAAIIAGYYFLMEHPELETAKGFIFGQIDRQWLSIRNIQSFPDEPSDPSLLNKLAHTIEMNLHGLRQAGHNVILPTLAIKAFRDHPDLITPSRVNGVCQMVELFTTQATELNSPVTDFPDFDYRATAAAFILKEFLACTEKFIGHGQGWSGHLLTYGMAIFDLRELGYLELAQKAEPGYRLYIDRIRQGPLDTDIPRQEHSPLTHFPNEDSYWENKTGDWNIGHILKYPYGFYGLLKWAEDEDLKQRCMEIAFRIF